MTAKTCRFGISLKTLMLLVLACGLWLGWRMDRARQQRRAVDAVTRHGGMVLFDWEYQNGQHVHPPRPRGRDFWRRLLGDEYFQEITYLRLDRDPKDSGGSAPTVDDTVLAKLKGLDKLEYLGVLKAQLITDDGLAELRNLGSLKIILLEDANRVTDAGLVHLVTNKNLESIAIAGSRITPAGFRSLGSLKSLVSISLADPELHDEDFAAIRNLTNLQSLFLGSCPITDRGLENLRGMKTLHDLHIEDTRITDRGLTSLSGRPELWSLSLPGNCTITMDGVARYRAAKPVNTLFTDLDGFGQGSP